MSKELPFSFSEIVNHVDKDAQKAYELYADYCLKRIDTELKVQELNRLLEKAKGESKSLRIAAESLGKHMEWKEFPTVIDERVGMTLKMAFTKVLAEPFKHKIAKTPTS